MALISVTVNGSRAAGSSEGGSTSADGRYVLFRSTADAVGYEGPGPVANLFVRDQVAGTTEPVRIEMQADQAMLSANGRFVAFASGLQIYVHDRQSGLTQRVSVRSGGAPSLEGEYREPFISATGRYVVFVGERSDLAPEYPNDWAQVFLHDRQTRMSEAVSVNLYGGFTDDDAGAPSVTPDGRYVVFHSQANNLVPNDIYGDYDIFVRDRQSGTTERVSVDMRGGSLTGRSLNGSISADGRYVAFWSDAPDVVPGDSQWHEPDIFVRDRLEARTERVTFGLGGTQPNSGATGAMISATGRYVMFTSDASNIVEHDTNETTDVFVRDRVARTTERVSLDSTGAQVYAPSRGSSITYGGRRVVIESAAPYIVANDFNASSDVYMREITGIGTGTTAFTLRPGALDFGDQQLFTSETRRFWLQNTGNVPLPILRRYPPRRQ